LLQFYKDKYPDTSAEKLTSMRLVSHSPEHLVKLYKNEKASKCSVTFLLNVKSLPA
jgi:hypothetical protein